MILSARPSVKIKESSRLRSKRNHWADQWNSRAWKGRFNALKQSEKSVFLNWYNGHLPLFLYNLFNTFWL